MLLLCVIYDVFDELIFGGNWIICVFCLIDKIDMKIEVVMVDMSLCVVMIIYL